MEIWILFGTLIVYSTLNCLNSSVKFTVEASQTDSTQSSSANQVTPIEINLKVKRNDTLARYFFDPTTQIGTYDPTSGFVIGRVTAPKGGFGSFGFNTVLWEAKSTSEYSNRVSVKEANSEIISATVYLIDNTTKSFSRDTNGNWIETTGYSPDIQLPASQTTVSQTTVSGVASPTAPLSHPVPTQQLQQVAPQPQSIPLSPDFVHHTDVRDPEGRHVPEHIPSSPQELSTVSPERVKDEESKKTEVSEPEKEKFFQLIKSKVIMIYKNKKLLIIICSCAGSLILLIVFFTLIIKCLNSAVD